MITLDSIFAYLRYDFSMRKNFVERKAFTQILLRGVIPCEGKSEVQVCIMRRKGVNKLTGIGKVSVTKISALYLEKSVNCRLKRGRGRANNGPYCIVRLLSKKTYGNDTSRTLLILSPELRG